MVAWMDAVLPAVGAAPKDVTVKIAVHGNFDVAGWRRAAKVVACTDNSRQVFYLYYLRPMDICDFLYCAATSI